MASLSSLSQLVRELDITGGDEKKVGYYVGLIVSTYSSTSYLLLAMLRLLLWATALSNLVAGAPVADCSSKAPAFFLAGDSTNAASPDAKASEASGHDSES